MSLDSSNTNNAPKQEQAIVKWYSMDKGYGFVLVSDPNNGVLSDLFIHKKVVKQSGFTLIPQQIIMVERGFTHDGKTCVTKVVSVLSEGRILD